MTFEELMSQMESVGSNGTSKFKMREESNQTLNKVPRFNNLKKGLKKKSKLLVVLEMAIPFNPTTGVEDETYHANNKYRPAYSATTVALALKELANKNEATKKAFLTRSGMKEWDTSDCSKLTETDWQIFKKYRVPRIFTIPAVHIDIPAMTRSDYGRDYAISVERDDTGNIVGDVPLVLQVHKLYMDRAYEEVQALNDRLDRGEESLTDKQKSEAISDIYRKSPVSGELRLNWVQMIELPMTPKYDISSDIDLSSITSDVVADHVVLSKYTKAIKERVEEYQRGDLEMCDKYFDYYEIDMVCPNDGDDSTNTGKMRLGLDTKFEKPTLKLLDAENYQNFVDASIQYLDSNNKVEEMVKASTRVAPYTEEVERQMARSLKTVIDLENDDFFTAEVLKKNSDVVTYIFGDAAADLLADIEADVSDKPKGVLDESESAKSADSFDLKDLNDKDFADGLDE